MPMLEEHDAAPLYSLQDFPEVDYPLTSLLVQNGILYDIPGEGTYLSRWRQIVRQAAVYGYLPPVKESFVSRRAQSLATISLFSTSPRKTGEVLLSGGGISYVGPIEFVQMDGDTTRGVVIYSPHLLATPHPAFPQGGFVKCRAYSKEYDQTMFSPIQSYLMNKKELVLPELKQILGALRSRLGYSEENRTKLDELEIETVAYYVMPHPRSNVSVLSILQHLKVRHGWMPSVGKLEIVRPYEIPDPYFVVLDEDDLVEKQISILKAIYGVTLQPRVSQREFLSSMSCVDVLVKKLYSEPVLYTMSPAGLTDSQLAQEINVPMNQIPLLLSGRDDIVKWHLGRSVRWIPNSHLNIKYGGHVIRELWDKWLFSHRLALGSATLEESRFIASFFFLNNRPVRSTVLVEGVFWLLRSPNRIKYRDWGRDVET